MYRISVTTLEKFRRFMVGASSFDTEEALIDTIMGRFTGNDKTRFGSAFGAIIEKGDSLKHTYCGIEGYLSDGIFFPEEQVYMALDYRERHPHAIYEVPVFKTYNIGEEQVQVSGRTDVMEGIRVRDAKCKFRSVDWQEYVDSYQWRYYLDMTGQKEFFYDVFEVFNFDTIPGGSPATLPQVVIEPHEPLSCVAYEGMHEDCQSLLYRFFEYVEARGLFQYIKKAV